jgi:hypothetical protein
MTLKCDQCKDEYDIYCIPKKLPCGNNICTACEFTNNRYISNRRLKCEVCKEYHDVPEAGFPSNSQLLEKICEQEETNNKELLEINNNDIMNNSKVKSIQQLLSSFKNIYEIAIDELNEHCTEQKRLVQLTYESKIFDFESEKNKNFQKLEKLESDNEKKTKIQKKKNPKQTKNDGNEIFQDLLKFSLETSNLKKSNDEIDEKIRKTQSMHDNLIEQLESYQSRNVQNFKLSNYIKTKIEEIIKNTNTTLENLQKNSKIAQKYTFNISEKEKNKKQEQDTEAQNLVEEKHLSCFDENILETTQMHLEKKLKFFQNLIFNGNKIDFQTKNEDGEEIGFFEYDKCGTVIFFNFFSLFKNVQNL